MQVPAKARGVKWSRLEPAPASHVLHDDHSMALLHSMHLTGYEILEVSAVPQHLVHPDDVVVV